MSSSCFFSESYLTKAKSTFSLVEGFLWQRTEINISILGLGRKQGILLVFRSQKSRGLRAPFPGCWVETTNPHNLNPSKPMQTHRNGTIR